MSATSSASRKNRLASETSPYLLQHQDNPVDWWPWGPEALAEARRLDRPILLSVGYAACHWCHVMAHESFEDPATAAVMNELYVNIKVDREERPDIDQIYMTALHLLGEQGGWPLTMFLTPAGEPVWGGTYFPKTSRYGRPGFVDVLREFARIYRDQPARIEQNRQALLERLRERAGGAGGSLSLHQLDRAADRLGEMFDPVNGGLKGAPKFPQASLFEFMLRAAERGRDRAFALVDLTLDRICRGGIYDHLGGGFARYSVDERWLVPHFEKMLYDNAQLLELLALVWGRNKSPRLLACAFGTVDWLRREMLTREGAFASSLDADSEGEEGKFYVWTYDEIESVLGPEAADFAAQYGVTRAGNFEEANILNQLAPVSGAEEEKLAAMRALLLEARCKRVRPGLDDKVLADWNGLMIAALVRAGLIFAEPDWVGLARRAFQFVAAAMTRGDRLGHSWRNFRLLYPGLASDHAAMVRAALALYEATSERTYLDHAVTWQQALERHYADPQTGGYFLTADDAEGLVVRPFSIADDATANPHALAAMNLVRLAALTGDDAYRARADRLFDGLLPEAARNVFAHAGLLNTLDLRLRATEVVVTGEGSAPGALAAAARASPAINRIVLRVYRPDVLAPNHPARAMIASAPEGAAFICCAETCSPPVRDADALARALAPHAIET